MSQNLKTIILKEMIVLKEEIRCTICLDTFTEPITLTTCQHTFCFECFKGLFSNKTDPKSVECPICKRLTNRRAYYLNEHVVVTIELLKMYDQISRSLDEQESEKDDMYDRTNRIKKFLDDCMKYQGSGSQECISLSSSSDETDSVLMKKENNNRPKSKVSKMPNLKTKSLICTKVKGKYPQKRQRKAAENAIINDVIKIDEYDSHDVCELGEEEHKIVKLLEDDYIRNLENEFQNINKDEGQHNNETNNVKVAESNQNQKIKHESNVNEISKSVESNSSKKTATATGWSRMKTMKKQIKKKEVKYKQLNVSTEMNKSKSKSPQDKNIKLPDIVKEPTLAVVLHRLDSNTVKNLNKSVIPEVANTSNPIKIENISSEKLDLLLERIEEDKNKNQHEEDDIFSLCTQKLQNPQNDKQQKDDEIRICSAEQKICKELKKCKSDMENNIDKFIVDVQIHHTSTPVKIATEIEEIIVERNCLKQAVKENICDLKDEIIKSTESSKLCKRNKNVGKSSEETNGVISASATSTPNSIKQLGAITRRSLRSATKRKSDEHKPAVNKTFPKRKKTNKQNSNDEIIEISSDQDVSKKQMENKVALIENQKNDDTSTKANKITDKNTTEENIITEEENLLNRQDFVKNELNLFSVQEPIVLSALQSSINAIHVVLSQCSNYVNSESLFSESWPSKNSKKSKVDTETNDKPKVLPHRCHSLSLQSNSRSSVNFYGTAIPCLKKIEDFYNQIISLSQQVSEETENFKNILNCTGDKIESLVVSLKKKNTNNVEVQTDNITCPMCCSTINFKSNKIVSEEITVLDDFKEINDLDNISNNFSNENNSQISKEQSDSFKQIIHSSVVQNPSTISKENSQKSSQSVFHNKKVNRQLTYSDDTNDSQRRKFKRIRSPTSDSDSESIKSKKSNTNYSKLLYRDDIDIFFQSEPSQTRHTFSLSSQINDKLMKKQIKKFDKEFIKANTNINRQDTTSEYISILEREYKDAQFDKISKPEQPVGKQNFDTVPNTVLDNLLGNINLSVFENENFEPENKNTNKKSQLIVPLCTETDLKRISIEKRSDNSIPYTLSASMFLNTEKEVLKISDVDKTKSIEKLNLDAINTIESQNADEKELDKEVENLTTHDLAIDDSLGSDKDIFGEDNIVESTPQKIVNNRRLNKRERSKFEFIEQLPDPILDIIEPPPTTTENLDWINIAPPPPPEFQDTEHVEEPKLKVQNVSSITPDIFALNPIDKGFFTNSTFLSGNTTNKIKDPTQRNVRKESIDLENVIPNSITQEKEEILKDQENLSPNKKLNIPSNPESSIWRRNLNPIVLAQKEKFSPLQIIVNQNLSPKPVVSLTPKHQKSILSYIQSSHKENNANDTNKNISRSCTAVKQNVCNNNKQNIFVPIKENLQIEVCESPVPQNNSPSTSFMKGNKIVNKSSNENNSSILDKTKSNYCIAYTRLQRNEVCLIISLTQKLNAKTNRDFDKSVTHLIVSVDNQNKIKDHTIKYVLGIAHSVWILSFAWIQDSIQHNRFLPEEPYEVLDVSGSPGPKISRLTRLTNPLFKNFIICCVEPFLSVNRNDIENAIIYLGGEIRKSPFELEKSIGKYCLILAEAKQTQDFDQYQVWRETLNVLAIDIEWFSRTIGQYQITSVRPYILCLETGINDLGYPFALIAPVPETPSQMTMSNTNH